MLYCHYLPKEITVKNENGEVVDDTYKNGYEQLLKILKWEQ